MRVALAQIAPRLNRSNLEEALKTVLAYKQECDLIIFPELSLSGYMLQDKLFEDAWSVDELDALMHCSLDVDIVVGAALREGVEFKNSALYFCKGKLLSQHDKVYLPNYGMFEEARYFQAGRVFESFITRFGRVCMVVCEDLWHKRVHHDLMQQNPDFIIALAASPARGFSDSGLEIQKQWYEIIQSVAQECGAKLFFCNRVGFEDGLGFWGGSCIVDEQAHIVHEMPRYKKRVEIFEIEEKI